MARRGWIRIVGIGMAVGFALFMAAIWFAGDLLIHPAPARIGAPPRAFPARKITFHSASGSMIHGWFARGRGRGAVLLLPGVRANRLSMLDRAEFLLGAGYSVLLIDFQASGESPGRKITFGYLESRDASAAVTELKTLAPGQPVGVLGTSMGGAAVLLAKPPLKVDAMILEQVYPTLAQALDDRMRLHAGLLGEWIEPLLALTVKPHLGFTLQQMRPIDHIRTIRVPKLLIAGSADMHTRLSESLAMFRAAAPPKNLWIVPGARHVNLGRLLGLAYKRRILRFFDTWLRDRSRPVDGVIHAGCETRSCGRLRRHPPRA